MPHRFRTDPGFSALTGHWPARALAALEALDSPWNIQLFLDQTPYSTEPVYRSPLSVLRDRKAHCFDGACLAAAALRRLGFPPLLLDLRAHNDDDHVLALFQVEGHWGAVAKSNTTVLRFREPVYRTRRELVMSYFDLYYNLNGTKALRDFSDPVDLRAFDRWDWMGQDATMDRVADRLYKVHHTPLLTDSMIARLSPVGRDVYAAGLMGSNAAGLFQPQPD